VETAIVLLAFLTLVFGMLELGIAVMRHNIVSQAARQGARRAIVRGDLAPPQFEAWGPEAYNASANSSDEIAETIRPYLAGLDLDRTTIQMEWIDGNNETQSRVRVTVTTAHDPFLTFLFTSGWTLTGVSTMSIAH
jgi:Flp pilus assembly protein TadG